MIFGIIKNKVSGKHLWRGKCWWSSVEQKHRHGLTDEFDPNYMEIFLEDTVVMILP